MNVIRRGPQFKAALSAHKGNFWGQMTPFWGWNPGFRGRKAPFAGSEFAARVEKAAEGAQHPLLPQRCVQQCRRWLLIGRAARLGRKRRD